MLVQGTTPENQRQWGVDPNTGRATDTLGYHPVRNPDPGPAFAPRPVLQSNPTPLNMEGLTEEGPPTFLTSTNQQGLRGFTIPTGRGPAWEQQLRDTLHARYQRPQPAQQAGPPLALGEQVPSGSTEPRQSSRV